jgi:ATP-dependent helicase/nuclease subunit B
MICAGSFRPAMSEITFGKSKIPGSTIGEFLVPLNDGRTLSLNGRIDRIDIAQINGRKVALIFDYKTSQETFNWSRFLAGLDIQLPIYMLAVKNIAPGLADDIAGVFYLPIKSNPSDIKISKISNDDTKPIRKAKGVFNGQYFNSLEKEAAGNSRFYNFYVTKENQPYGIYKKLGALTPDDFEIFLKYCSQKIIALAEQIVSGKITVEPYRLSNKSPCQYCDYMPLCRFDWQINNYKNITVADKQQALEEMKKK